MLREIELSAAMFSHVSVPPDGLSASCLLPTSKQNCRAVGVTRTWDCICDLPTLGRSCPVHALVRQLARVQALSVQLRRDPSTMPLFPSADGLEVDKADLVATIFRAAEALGEPVRNHVGGYWFGGHSLRAGGAHLLASR